MSRLGRSHHSLWTVSEAGELVPSYRALAAGPFLRGQRGGESSIFSLCFRE